MSLYESGESNGEVSLLDLFNNKEIGVVTSTLNIDQLIFAICRGGWPRCLLVEKNENKLVIAKDLYQQLINYDIKNIDNVRRSKDTTSKILQSYARNICTLASLKTIWQDVNSTAELSYIIFLNYIEALKRLYVIEDIPAWNPSIRSKTSIRASTKRNFIDPSIAVAALKLSPECFNTDFNTLGFLFESLCIRDLKAYSSKYSGEVSYYHDRYGLEADCVLHLEDGRYILIEFKLGDKGIELGAKHLAKLENIIKNAYDKNDELKLRLPSAKVIITCTPYGYKRQEDGVYVIPIGCLKD